MVNKLFSKAQDFLLLQINDSLFPIGAYSHSYGLETYIQRGLVHDETTAREYICNYLHYNFLYNDLLLARLAYDKALAGDIAALEELEEVATALRVPKETREALHKLGRRFSKILQTLPQLEAMEPSPILEKYLSLQPQQALNYPIVYGVCCASLGLDIERALAHYLYTQTSALVTNCVKTIPLSQSAGQQMLTGLFADFNKLITEAMSCKEIMLGRSTPGFDLRGMEHEYLYSRLYMS